MDCWRLRLERWKESVDSEDGYVDSRRTTLSALTSLRFEAWIFIIEGIMTVVAGFFSFRYVYDFPADAKFLTTEEKAMVEKRLRIDQGASGEVPFHRSHLIAALTDWKVSKTLESDIFDN